MADSILNVENSLMQARWVFPKTEQNIVARIARTHGVPEIIARLLNARGVAENDVDAFLYPKLSKHFPDPFVMAGMADMASFMAAAISAGRKIGIFADFDVDGATSSAVLLRFLRHLGQEPPVYIPDRLAEGYGPNVPALKKLKEQGAEIVVICDCGITAFDVIEQGRALELDIIVLDHHEAEDRLPAATHVINPKRKDDKSGYTMLAACGVTFLACVAINAKLRETGFYSTKNISEPSLKDWLDIVALGTVCDMVPLKGPNRLFVRFGFERMAQRANPGIRALLEVARVTGAPSPYTAGFVLGPRINAGSRVHKADLGARILSTDDAEEARNIAFTLNDCNDKRKELQAEMLAHAVNIVEDEGLHRNPVIVVGSEGWHPGLSGLVAGNLKEKYGKPSVVIAWGPGDGGRMEGKGSGRSIPGVNMGAAFIDARNREILYKGGGHAMAAGFTLFRDRFDDFRAFLNDHVGSQIKTGAVAAETVIDGVLSVRGAAMDFVKIIQNHFGPFGQDHAEPLFVLPHVRVHMADVVGSDHVRCMVSDWEGGGRLKAVAFRSRDTELGQALLRPGAGDYPLHLAGSFKINEWQGRESVELHITDAAPAQGVSETGHANVPGDPLARAI